MSEMLITFSYGVSMVPVVAPGAAEPANGWRFVNRGEQAEKLMFRNCSSL
ncbi:MAG: hypothetical protein M3N38_02585 [Pseudomonadota bacterium]|nr:hypothetical protein [Pseudomonadota bacterium]